MSVYAERVREALADSADTQKLAEAWVALHPSSVPQTSKAIRPELSAFLGRAARAIQNALRPVLTRLTTEAWVLGNRSALAAVDSLADVDWGGWKPGDYAAAEQIAGPGLRQLLGEQGIRIKSITDSRLEELSKVLEETLRSNEIRRQPGTEPLPPFLSVQDLAGRLKTVLDNPARAELVAQAEIARAQASAARQVYAETGRTEVEISSAEDDKVCPACRAAVKLGAHPLGAPPLVPLHPRCRCAELPVLATSGPRPAPQPEEPPAAPASEPAGPAMPLSAPVEEGAGQPPSLASLIPADDDEAADREEEIAAAITSHLEGEYAGLRVAFDGMEARPNAVWVSFTVSSQRGRQVGITNREFRRDPDGTLFAYHDFLELDEDVRGLGFAEAWNRRLEDWYRASGFARIELLANIDVGGYAWARDGYEFEGANEAEHLLDRLRRRAAALGDRPDEQRQARAAEAILEAARTHRFGDPGYPTAYEISQAGRAPGQSGRGAMWVGKSAMLGSAWHAVKYLREEG